MKRLCGRLPLLTGLLAVGGCVGLNATRPALPERYSLVREQLRIYSDFPLPAQHRLLEELAARRFDVGRRLGLPLSDEPIYVYLFQDPDRFRAAMRRHYPEFPRRRAFFVETDTRLIVYAHWGDRVAEDLRHELTHAYLHAVVPSLPLWLDEGLAEYFEVPRGRRGLNRPHLELLTAGLERRCWRPDLDRLRQFESSFEMSQEAYAESWAWVHFLLHSRAEHAGLLRGYLEQLRREGAAEPLSLRLARVLPHPEASLRMHLRGLATAKPVRP